MPKTLVFLHAHPDDEALLTAGTMARAASAGHRVILVMATDGSGGLAASDYAADLAAIRMRELAQSADVLRVARTIMLGLPDAGLRGETLDGFAHRDLSALADSLTLALSDEIVDTLVGYDAAGGYGHPDHKAIHRMTHLLSARLPTPHRLYEATLPREPIQTAVRLAARLHLTPPDFDPAEFDGCFTARRDITTRVRVRRWLDQKRAALAAHASQASSDGSTRTLDVLGRLPTPVFSALMGTEYYRRLR